MARPETIFALSSGGDRAGVAVLRVSGPAVPGLLERLAGPLPAPRYAALRTLRDPADGEVIDSGLVLFFPAPHSFTGEDVAEFHVHGAPAVVRRLLVVLGQQPGCGAAQSGEFSRRAWHQGKFDILEVEALADLVAAETDVQRKVALRGAADMRRLAAGWRRRLIGLRARVEAEIDFGDEGDVAARLDSATEQESVALALEFERAAAGASVGERLRQGFRVAILGPPNAGKSSLLNALAKRDVAIVNDRPGTTRDVLEVALDLDGFAVILSDAAGIRDTADEVEREGVRRAWVAAEQAELVLWANPIDSPTECPSDGFLEIRTKADLGDCGDPLAVSAQTGAGMDALIEAIRERAGQSFDLIGMETMVRNERQADALRRAAAALRKAAAHDTGTLDLRAEELRQACDCLDEFVGKVGHEQVLDEIFARFCIGK